MKAKVGVSLLFRDVHRHANPYVSQDNSSQRFIWFGGMPVLGGGKHTFEFLPGPEPNTTVFRQSEEFSGMMKIFYSDPEGKRGQGTIQNWNKVNGELKRAAEKKYKTEQPTVGAA